MARKMFFVLFDTNLAKKYLMPSPISQHRLSTMFESLSPSLRYWPTPLVCMP